MNRFRIFMLACLMMLPLVGATKTQSDYGVYNVGVCNGPDRPFFEMNLDIEADTITVIAWASDPESVNVIPPGSSFTYKYDKTTKDGYRIYNFTRATEHHPQLFVKFQDDQVVGMGYFDNKQSTTLHGHKGKLEDIVKDGNEEVKLCRAKSE